jgi:hypothetical protein
VTEGNKINSEKEIKPSASGCGVNYFPLPTQTLKHMLDRLQLSATGSAAGKQPLYLHYTGKQPLYLHYTGKQPLYLHRLTNTTQVSSRSTSTVASQ